MSMWDMLMGKAEPVSVMAPGPVRTERKDGLLSAVTEPLQYAPGPIGVVAGIGNAIANGDTGLGLLSGAALKSGPTKIAIAAGENARKIPSNVKRSLFEAADFGVPGQRYDDKAWVGLEGRPRWEISDRKALLVKPVDDFQDGAMIDKVLQHDELFKQYPELKGYRVMPLSKSPKHDSASEAIGAHDAKNKIIYLKEGLTKEEQVSVLLHELQHGVQKIEGHATGASSEEATHLAINMMVNYKNAEPAKQRLLRAQMQSEFGFDPEKHSIKRLSDRIYRKKYGEVEARTVQERRKQTNTKERTEIREQDGDFVDTMGRDEFAPVLWQDMWKQMFGTRELPPFVNLEKGTLIPIKDF